MRFPSGRLSPLLVALVVAVAACGSSGPERYLVSGTAAPALDLKSFLPVARHFVETHRGLTYKATVPVTTLNDSDFNKKLLDKQTTDAAAVSKFAREMEAMGLLQGHPDVAALEKSLYSGAVEGFYDTKEKQLFVRGVRLTPLVREVIVHELTHGLQDQYFGLDRPALNNANDERSEALLGLVEGDALRIEHEYVSSLSADEQQQASEEQARAAAGLPANIPPVLIEILDFPYLYGPKFVDAVLSARGQAGLDAAFTNPPTTSQQVVHPEKYLAHDAGQVVAKPAADATPFDDGILGEQVLDLLLEKAVAGGGLSTGDASAASQSWDGDHYVAWDKSAGVACMRTSFASRDSQSAAQLGTALQAYVSTVPNGTVESLSPIAIQTCSG